MGTNVMFAGPNELNALVQAASAFDTRMSFETYVEGWRQGLGDCGGFEPERRGEVDGHAVTCRLAKAAEGDGAPPKKVRLWSGYTKAMQWLFVCIEADPALAGCLGLLASLVPDAEATPHGLGDVVHQEIGRAHV